MAQVFEVAALHTLLCAAQEEADHYRRLALSERAAALNWKVSFLAAQRLTDLKSAELAIVLRQLEFAKKQSLHR